MNNVLIWAGGSIVSINCCITLLRGVKAVAMKQIIASLVQPLWPSSKGSQDE